MRRQMPLFRELGPHREAAGRRPVWNDHRFIAFQHALGETES